MNTIKIYLKPSGSTADVSIDFRIFKGSYRNKLIDIYVPKSVLYSNTEGTYMNAVKVGAILTSETGEKVNTQSYYANWIRDDQVLGVDYAIYEMTMPNAFTVAVGEQTIVVNVVNININNYIEAEVTAESVGTYYVRSGEEGNYTYTRVVLPAQYDESETYYQNVPIVMEVMTSQTCEFTVLESAFLGDDGLVDPSELDIVNGRLNNLEEDVDQLQEDLDVAEINIENNAEAIRQNTQDIADIKSSFSQGENYIGTITSNIEPIVGGEVPSGVKTTLNNYVQAQLGRAPKVGDTIIYIYQINGTDKNYKMIYGTDWSGYEIPPMELASNGTAGLVQGTYGTGDNFGTLVSIAGGKVTNIYVKNDNAYVDIHTWLNALQSEADATDSDLTSLRTGLSNGTVIVKKAEQDANGNNIVNTYMTQNAGATKEYVKDYALPKVFNDVYYITADGYTETVPDDVDPQFSVTTSSIGETQVFQLTRITTARYELSNKNSSETKIWLAADRNCDVVLRLKTEAYVDEQWTTLRTELSNTISLSANEIQKIDFGSSFIDLGVEVLKIVENDQIRQTLTVITEHSQETTFDVYSNETYPSTFTLETQSVTQISGSGELGEERVYNAIGTLSNGVITFDLVGGSVIKENTDAEFVLTYSGTIDYDYEAELELDTEKYRIVTSGNILSGNAKLYDLLAAQHYEQSGVHTWIFKGFIEKQGADTIVRVAGASKTSDLLNTGADGKSAFAERDYDYIVNVQNNTTITAHAFSANGNIFIVWGDGAVDYVKSGSSATVAHEYVTAGTYYIRYYKDSSTKGWLDYFYITPKTSITGYKVSPYTFSLTSDNVSNLAISGTLEIPNISIIGSNAFSGSQYTKIILNKVVQIQSNAFNGETYLEEVYGLENAGTDDLTSEISGTGLFSGCTALKHAELPDKISTSLSGTFNGCSSLEAVYIPSTVTTISTANVFTNASGSCIIYCEESSKPAGWVDGWNNNGTVDLEVKWGYTREQYRTKIGGGVTEQDLASKLNKPANPASASVVTMQSNGTVGTTIMDSATATASSIAVRDTNGCVKVATPQASGDATNKDYVDTAISNAISSVYKVQGSETVSNLNGMTKTQGMNGYVYNISVGGTLNNQDASTLTVSAGDNVVLIWDNGSWYWDKLASDIDLSGYIPVTAIGIARLDE